MIIPTVVGFYGKARTGKTTLANSLKYELTRRAYYVGILPVADKIREELYYLISHEDKRVMKIVKELGLDDKPIHIFDGPTTPQERRLFQMWGGRRREECGPHYWLMHWWWDIAHTGRRFSIIVVPDLRMPGEVQEVMWRLGGLVYHITNKPFSDVEIPNDVTEEVPPVLGTRQIDVPDKRTRPDEYAKLVSRLACEIIQRSRMDF